MAASKSADVVKQITYLATALKAPRITEAATRLAEQARDAGWTHEDYLAAVLEREVSARNASGVSDRRRPSLAVRVFERFGSVRLLCDNAGVVCQGRLVDTSDADWACVAGTNLFGGRPWCD